MRKSLSRFFGLALIGLAGTAVAQQVTTAVGLGSDFWTGTMAPELFQMHENAGDRACAVTELFVPVRGNLGFCITGSENAAGALEWEDAREACASVGKRLPEPGEYKFACQRGVPGLTDMGDDFEWVSNFPIVMPRTDASQPAIGAVIVPVAGNGSCNSMSRNFIGRSDNAAPASHAFRCVH
jgi:hypothetical protein